MLYFISYIFNQFTILLHIFHFILFLLSDIFHHISCHKPYLSDLFHQILFQYYLYPSFNSFYPISKLLYHQLIVTHHFQPFFSIMLCYIFIICDFSPLSSVLSSVAYWVLSSSYVKLSFLSFYFSHIFSYIGLLNYCSSIFNIGVLFIFINFFLVLSSIVIINYWKTTL